MIRKRYVVEISTDLETLFEKLNDYGIDYEYDEHWPAPGYIEISLNCVEGEIAFIERMFAPYV